MKETNHFNIDIKLKRFYLLIQPTFTILKHLWKHLQGPHPLKNYYTDFQSVLLAVLVLNQEPII